MKLTAIFNPQKLQAAVTPEALGAAIDPPVLREQSDPYPGPYIVTPTDEDQILQTDGLRMTDDVTVRAAGGAVVLVEKTIVQNGEYDPAADNADGYSQVTVSVPQPSGQIQITQNGVVDVSAYASANVAVPQGVIVPEGWAYYNGYLLPQIPYADGYNFAWIRANAATGMFDCVLGQSQWYALSNSGLNAWSLAFANNTTLGARQYSIPMDAQEQSTTASSWGEYTVSYASTYGTGNNRKPIYTDADIMIQGSSNICLRHGFPVPRSA